MERSRVEGKTLGLEKHKAGQASVGMVWESCWPQGTVWHCERLIGGDNRRGIGKAVQLDSWHKRSCCTLSTFENLTFLNGSCAFLKNSVKQLWILYAEKSDIEGLAVMGDAIVMLLFLLHYL